MSENLQDIAQQVEERAKELAPVESREPLEDDFVKWCLDNNERGDGTMFSIIFKDRFLYNVTPKDGEWYFWNGNVWEVDKFRKSFNSVEECALEYQRLAEPLQKEVREEGIDKKHPDAWKMRLCEKYKKRANDLRGETRVKKTLNYAPVVDTSMACEESDFNQMPMLLPVRNGNIDLSTGNLIPGRPCDRMSKYIDIDYDPHADYEPIWKFLVEVCGGSEEMASFLVRSFGYAITGHSYEQYIWVFLGPGRNGKGVLFSLIGELMGPFYHTINRGMILQQRNEPSPNAASEHKYSLLSKRIIVGAETNKNQKIDEAAVKDITGEDDINCRPNFGSEITFRPSHTLFLHTNHVPVGLTSDFAMRQRLLLIDFPNMYVDDIEAEKKKYPGQASKFRQKDKKLKKKLREYMPGLLRLLVEGCREWEEIGLSPPAQVLDSVNKLAEEEDYIGRFIRDYLDHFPSDKDIRLACTSMMNAFSFWWIQNMGKDTKRMPAMKTVNKSFRERGYEVEPVGGKTWIYGVQIKIDLEKEVKNHAYENA